MVTVVLGWATHGSNFKDWVGEVQDRSGNKVLQHSPAQALQPGFLSAYPFPLPISFPVQERQKD